ncbi:hypothetical protein P691DRAFT_765489 [Macrolepiota fuliginosa MF-IS2]|uniref:Uncharacterized protein n=1 Tax=Macrolepiota fuliginosa MF-IS2 TaxID=1400762 RepID=A0A9P5X212_9AGAR|nr:hypothetical protein P691DRAFT_765489 [Macrolepiota fuliginosa MF-IS2]
MPSIGEAVFSNDESAIISPVMAIILPPPNLTSILEPLSSVPSFMQVLQEPEPGPRPVVRKEPPLALSLDDTLFTQSPSVESEDHLPSDVVASGEESGMVKEKAGVEAVEVGVEAVEAVEIPQVLSSPTTLNVPQLSLPSARQPVPSQPAFFLLSPLLNLGINTGSFMCPASMIELSPTSSTDFNIPDRKINFDGDDDVCEQADHGLVMIFPQRLHSISDASAQPSLKAVVHHNICEVVHVLNQGPITPQTPQFRWTVLGTVPMSRTGSSSSNTFIIPPSLGTVDLANLLQSTSSLNRP